MRSSCAKGDGSRPREGPPGQGLEDSRVREAELQTFARMQKYSSRHPYGICLQPSRLTQPPEKAKAVPCWLRIHLHGELIYQVGQHTQQRCLHAACQLMLSSFCSEVKSLEDHRAWNRISTAFQLPTWKSFMMHLQSLSCLQPVRGILRCGKLTVWLFKFWPKK